jgi:hypothetical protein
VLDNITAGTVVVVDRETTCWPWLLIEYHKVGWTGVYMGFNSIRWQKGYKFGNRYVDVTDGKTVYPCDITLLKRVSPHKKRISPFAYWYLTTTKNNYE